MAYGQFFAGNPQLVSVNNLSFKKRPNTGIRKLPLFQFGNLKKAINVSKIPSSMESDANRIKPRNFMVDRERLFDDAMKQKIAANFLKEENVKLKTKI